MAEIQLSDKDGDAILVLRAGSVEEFGALLADVLSANNPVLGRFNLASDTAKAAAKVQKAFPGSSTGSESPLCPECGGTTSEKRTKADKPYWACNQDNGECLNDKGFPTSVWSKRQSRGRDS
jgi:hypothetical protein